MASRRQDDIDRALTERVLRDPVHLPAAPRYIPHTPFAKQEQFLELRCREALYGGAAGGGKSDALLMDALRWVHVPNYAALILRRTHKELVLQGALIDRSQEWLGPTNARWRAEDKSWVFPSGAVVQFGYFDTWNDRMRYQSAQWNRIYFDELTHFPEEWYRFMFTRTRRLSGDAVPTAMRGGTNPGGIGHAWVHKRFILERDPDRAFVPANFRENPHIDQDDYERQLGMATPIVRRQMLGEWVQDAYGNVYGNFDPTRNVTNAHPAILRPKLSRFVLGLDFGVTDPTAFVVLGWAEHERKVYVLEAFKESGMLAEEAAMKYRELDARYHFERVVGDLGGLGKAYANEMTVRFQVPMVPAEKSNKHGYIMLLDSALARGELVACASSAEPLIREWVELPWDEAGQKEAAGFDNHCADACLYAWRAAHAYLEEPAADRPKAGTPDYFARQVEEHQERLDKQFEREAREARDEAAWDRMVSGAASLFEGENWDE